VPRRFELARVSSSRPVGSLARPKPIFVDLQASDSRLEHRSRNAQFRGGTGCSGDSTSAFGQGGLDELTFLIEKRSDEPSDAPAFGLAAIDVLPIPCRKN
jgi:hypothetical protein